VGVVSFTRTAAERQAAYRRRKFGDPPTRIQRGGDIAWKNEGNCVGVDPDLFFPDRGEATREAKQVCAGCPVKRRCLEYALDAGEKFGVWGGKSERRRLRAARRAS
jgi:WhiB family redox-sensing transcriptional regulator